MKSADRKNLDVPKNKSETELTLAIGNNTVYIPDFFDRDCYGKPEYVSPDETLQRINTFYKQIYDQGGRIVDKLTVTVRTPPLSIASSEDYEDTERTVLIIEKLA